MKCIVSALIFLLIGNYCNAQLNVVLENQYEETLDSLTVTINGTNYITDGNGMVSVNATPSGNLTITAKGHKTTEVAVAKIGADKKITVKRTFTWKDILNPMFYIINGGLWLILLIIFAETGLFAGFFLPGDSLLFVAGITSSELVNTVFPVQNEYVNLLILIIMISLAGIIGNSLGYWFGKKVGPTMYTWKDRMLFKKKYLHQAHEFYEKHGGIAIVGARFLPMVRTFAPIIAGIVGMDKKKFTYYNIIGSFLWVSSLIIAGHFLQKWIFEWYGFDLKSNLEYIVIGIVLVTTGPVLYKMFFSKPASPAPGTGKGTEESFNKNHTGEEIKPSGNED
jgi:membrane-associated protein